MLTRNLNTLDLSLSKTPSLHVDLSKYASPEFLHEGLAAAGSGGRDARGAAELGLGALRRGEFGGGELAERLRAAAAGGEDPMGEEEAAQVRLVAESVLHAMRTDSASGGVARVVVVRRSEARPAEGVLREFLFEQTTSASEIRILKGETSRLR
ncbi:hypothetical protein TeGR_g9715 [Tetraparma gracilis]|uniref:Uncharacterized protein n=1 Tax=Tetraparma gracilis TaxID=2962635 RepID=A0ABQ6MLI0_9STRA|nr:hypothetical protein TeGR_g9715 [Tetraparma gracilis]